MVVFQLVRFLYLETRFAIVFLEKREIYEIFSRENTQVVSETKGFSCSVIDTKRHFRPWSVTL